MEEKIQEQVVETVATQVDVPAVVEKAAPIVENVKNSPNLGVIGAFFAAGALVAGTVMYLVKGRKGKKKHTALTNEAVINENQENMFDEDEENPEN